MNDRKTHFQFLFKTNLHLEIKHPFFDILMTNTWGVIYTLSNPIYNVIFKTGPPFTPIYKDRDGAKSAPPKAFERNLDESR